MKTDGDAIYVKKDQYIAYDFATAKLNLLDINS